ncbi:MULTISPECIES: hypothetical protein [unclassified Streptomyces]|uniref:hypothetical protein n=1 Tax=unclassified Streptomyces TaxID=2593676 RepID=UPI0033A10162
MARDVRIELSRDGFLGSITVDGQPIRGVRAVSVEGEIGHRPIVRLEMLVHDVGTIAEPDAVLIPDDTAAALVALGWTPPPGQEVTDAAP